MLDITHPLFISSIDEAKLARMLADIEKKGQERAKSFQKIPTFIRRFLIKRSLIMAELLSAAPDTRSLSGWGTLLMKMGPGLIGRGRKRFLDRLASRSAGAVMIRMRLRDICRFQAETLTRIRARLLGIGQLKSLFERTRWRLDRTYRGNPRYEVFLLRKELTSSSG